MKILLFVIIILITSCRPNANNANTIATTIANNTHGEELYKTQCANCHKINENYIGPSLKGATTRWPSNTLLYDFVRNSQEVIARNEYAKKIFMQYKQSPMLPFPHLSDNDIEQILQYCDSAK